MLPKANFTYWNLKDTQGANPFAEYGDYCGVDLIANNNGDGEAFVARAQKEHCTVKRLVAKTCIRPILSLPPTTDSFTIKEIINAGKRQKSIEENEKRSSKLLKTPCSKGQDSQFSRLEKIEARLSDPDKVWFTKEDVKNLRVPGWLTKLKDENDKLAPYLAELDRWRHASNCIDYLHPHADTDASGALVYLSGPLFDAVSITSVTHGNGERLRPTTTTSLTLGPLHGIASSRCQDHRYVVVLHREAVSMIPVIDDVGGAPVLPTFVGDVWNLACEERPLSAVASPYVVGDCIVALASGTLKSWNADAGRCGVVCRDREPRFTCSDIWWQVEYGGHPQRYVLADRTGVEMIDARTRGGGGGALFVLPTPYLQHHERVRAMKPLALFAHAVATDHSLFVVDERFPGYPMIEWGHSLATQPRYINVLPWHGGIESDDDNAILLGGQSPAPPFMFHMTAVPGEAPQSLLPPWMIAPISDGSHGAQRAGFFTERNVLDRLEKAPIIGACLVPYSKDGFSVVQYSLYGDAFYQTYATSEDVNADVTCRLREGFGDPQLTDDVVDEYREWCCLVEMQLMESGCVKELTNTVHVDTSLLLAEFVHTSAANERCHLCNAHVAKAESWLPGDTTCPRCGVRVNESGKLCAMASEGTFPQMEEPAECELLRELESLGRRDDSKDSYSVRLAELWDEATPVDGDEEGEEEVAMPSVLGDAISNTLPKEPPGHDHVEELLALMRGTASMGGEAEQDMQETEGSHFFEF
ncbi:PREDICTED: uncharacterized protein LOC106811467 isoform X1 [Priapulus caudatus]|uniref:Uncharacterized protein LOC106811467 isoform X1 n=1 Tax=Priapulus caudatus TaxID=37621 RepID=A0ABM1EEF4_PRICU|nr:PREDICTED: uncharacterized protein LOC106811467 isoform X1 [Priapulus caudatus]